MSKIDAIFDPVISGANAMKRDAATIAVVIVAVGVWLLAGIMCGVVWINAGVLWAFDYVNDFFTAKFK